jgi:hypothetical protein
MIKDLCDNLQIRYEIRVKREIILVFTVEV